MLDRYKYFLILLVLAFVGIILFGLWGYYTLGNWAIFKAWVPMMFVIIIWGAWIFYFLPWQYSRMKENQMDFDNGYFEFDEEYFTYTRDDGSISKRPYRSIPRITNGKDYYVFWENISSIHILPHSAFKSNKDIEELNKLLKL